MAKTTQGRLSRDDWSRYWRKSTITTFSRRFEGNYDGAFAAFWQHNFERVGDNGHIIDLATGNGAVALLAHDFGTTHGRSYRVTGIDYADIRPAADLPELEDRLSAIHFLAHTDIADTGLPDGDADLLTSQYGFEYATLQPAAHEAYRLLRPGGRIALIVHHDDSHVLRQTRDAVAQMRYVMQKERLDQKITALVKAMGSAETPGERQRLRLDPKAESLRKKLNASVQRINARAEAFEDPEGFIDTVVPNFMNVFGALRDQPLDTRLRYVARIRKDIQAFQERMADLASAACSEADITALIDALVAAGFVEVEQGLLEYGPQAHLMGWTLTARR